MADERCIHELLPGQCAPCRGLKSPEDEAAEARTRLLASGRGWRTAQWPGACAACGSPFYPPQVIRFERTDNPFAEYRADCCPIREDRS